MSRNDSKHTYAKAVITAAYQGDVRTAIAQLGAGADVDACDCDGDTALMLAAERGHIELMKVLLKNGADVDAENLDGDAGDIAKSTPLMRAAYRGHVDVVKELLAHGADANARNAFGNTAVTLAAHNGHSKIESMLREAHDVGFVDQVQPKLRAARH
jgi:ankyrin repeat protein